MRLRTKLLVVFLALSLVLTNRYDGELDIDCDDGTTVTLRFEGV